MNQGRIADDNNDLSSLNSSLEEISDRANDNNNQGLSNSLLEGVSDYKDSSSNPAERTQKEANDHD